MPMSTPTRTWTLDATVAVVRGVAEAMGQRDDFRGFTTRDVEILARAFRFTGQ